MKTAIKLTALALITVLVALACSDPVSLSGRNYSDRNESKSIQYTNSPGSAYLPIIFNSLTYYSDLDLTTVVSLQDREETITFPDGADILKADNTTIEAKLKEFLTLSQYSNPTAIPADYIYEPSTLTTGVDYKFVRRSGNDIIVIVTVPDIDNIVAKVDASKYKVYGQPLDTDGDGKVDEYDDYYKHITIIGSTKHMMDTMYSSAWNPPVFGPIDIGINGPSGGLFLTTDATPKLFIIYNRGIGGTTPGDINDRKILSDIVPLIEIQKYDQASNTWAKDGTVALYDSTTTAPTGTAWTTDIIYGSFTPVDLGIYRVIAKDVANLTTKANYGASSKPAKITINGASFLTNTVYTDPVSYYNGSIRQWVEDNHADFLYHANVSYDSNRKNIVLDMFFDKIRDNKADPSVDVWLESMTTDEFNKNFKLVYDGLNPSSKIPLDADLTNYTNIVELKVIDVKYSASKYFDATNTKINCITVTLDPSFQYNGNRNISFLITTGFKYGGGHITFGDPRLENSYYNGSYFWRSYGGSDYIITSPATPSTPGHWNPNGSTDPDTDPSDGSVWVDTIPGHGEEGYYDGILSL